VSVARIVLELDEHGLWSAEAHGPMRPEGTYTQMHRSAVAALWKVAKRALTDEQLAQAMAEVTER
jgi:hypothetical protein